MAPLSLNHTYLRAHVFYAVESKTKHQAISYNIFSALSRRAFLYLSTMNGINGGADVCVLSVDEY